MKIRFRRAYLGTAEYRRLLADGWTVITVRDEDNLALLTRAEG